jgi:hypothetical protein
LIGIGPNQGFKTMFFSRAWRTLPKNLEKIQLWGSHYHAQKWAFFILTNHNIIHKHVLFQKTNKKYQNNKIKHEILNPKTYNLKKPTCSCNMDSKLVF